MVEAQTRTALASQGRNLQPGGTSARTRRLDRESRIGRLDKALDEAQARGWTSVDMKRDWKRVYPFE
jgi:hypothetical protein